MDIFVINLDRRPDRLERFSGLSVRLGFRFQRIAAVDGSTDSLRARAANSPRGFLGWKIDSLSLACFESHRKAWRALLDSQDPYAIVMEDDVVLSEEIQPFLEDGWIPSDADIVRLETYRQPSRFDRQCTAVVAGRAIYRLRSLAHGTGAYIVSRGAAEFLLAQTETITDPVDEALFNDQAPLFSKLRIYQILPAPAVQGFLLAESASEPWSDSAITDMRRKINEDAPNHTGIKTTRLWQFGRASKYYLRDLFLDLRYPRRDVPFR